jgi:hypothetical protein
MERNVRLKGLFYIYLKFLIKISLNKKKFLLSKALGKERPSTFLKSGPLWKQTPISSEGALPAGAPYRAPMERDAPFHQLPIILLQSPRYTIPILGSPAGPL